MNTLSPCSGDSSYSTSPRRIDRLHILAGLLIAYLNIDEVIAIIRERRPQSGVDEPWLSAFKPMRFEYRLRQLAKLEELNYARKRRTWQRASQTAKLP